MTKEELIRQSEAYVDELIGPGMGKRHSAFIAGLGNAHLRETLHGYHVLESDTEHLSIEENYLLGMVVLYAGKSYATAGMFAKTLLHRGVAKEKLLEAIARLSMWVGGVVAAEAAGQLERAIRDHEAKGIDSMKAWFPKESSDGE